MLWKSEDRQTAMWIEENTQRSMAQFSNVIELKAQPILYFVNDYSYWDEFVAYIGNRSEHWWRLNILEGIRKYNCAVILLFDIHGNLINAAYTDGMRGFERSLNLSAISFDRPVFYHFFTIFNGRLYEVFASPVQPSSDEKRESHPRGYFFAAQEWNEEYLEELRHLSLINITLHRSGDCKIPAQRKISLGDLDNREIACIEVRPDTTLMKKMEEIQKSQLLLFVGLAFLFIILVSWLARRGLTEPLSRIISAIKENGPEKIKGLKYSADEIGLIARELDEFFASKGVLEQYRNAINASNIVSISDYNGKITYVNDEFSAVTGYSSEEAIGRTHQDLLKAENPAERAAEFMTVIREGGIWSGINKNFRKDGSSLYIKTTIAPLRDAQGNVREFIGIMTDITDAYERLKTIHDQTTDFLTGLPNRQKLLEDVKTEKEPLFALINVDRFRDINESYGHETGDEMLRIFGKRLIEYESDHSRIYRIYGDAFALLSSGHIRETEFITTCRNIIDDFDRYPVIFEEISFPATVRIGIATYDDVLIHSEMALTYAKEKKENLVIFEKNIDFAEMIQNGMIWTKKIKAAIAQDEILLFGQKISPTGEGDVKYECLMRLRDEEGRIHSPLLFLDFAKRAKLYPKLTQMMIKSSFEYFISLPNEFSINISLEDILNTTTSHLLLDMLDMYGIGDRVVVEILESEGIENFQDVNGYLEKLRRYGVRIAIDDFGKGYSNFDYLIKLKVDYLKIDGSLIRNIDHDRHAHMMVETIAEFARKLGIQTVAEFVHSEAVYRTVLELPIDFVQGYYVHEPERLEIMG